MEITIKNLSKDYGKGNVLSNLNCTFCSGELIGIVGTNGAGKSTLIKILSTILKPSSGDVLLDGVSIVKHPEKMKKLVGYLPQEVAFYPNLTASEFLCYIAAIKGINKKKGEKEIENLLEMLHLNNTGNKKLVDFSGGMRQRVGIACTLLGNPEIIIVDEPTVGLDPQERITLRNILSKLSETHIVILSTHIVSDIESIASSLLLLNKGKLLYNGSPSKLVGLAQGHVWEYTTDDNKDISISSAISSMVQTEHGIKVRQVSKQQPYQGAKLVNPSLEDACIYKLEE